MTKKKNVTSPTEEFDDTRDLEEELKGVIPSEDSVDDENEDESEEESEDGFVEDDRALIAKLEQEDREEARKVFRFDEEIGFNPLYDWDHEPEKNTDDARLWLSLSADELSGFKFGKNDSLAKKWIIALACKNNGLHEQFREIVNKQILKARKKDERLLLEDICFELVDDLVLTEEYDAALALLSKAEKDFGADPLTVLRANGLVLVRAGKTDEARAAFDRLINRPFNAGISGYENEWGGEENRRRVQFEIALSLSSIHQYSLAREYFDRARKLAEIDSDTDLILEIETALDQANRAEKAE